MCRYCPHCNLYKTRRKPCQDRFGTNMMLMGVSLGSALTFGGATEYQELTAPHFHGQAQVASVYQYKTLREISQMIRDGLLDPESVVRYTEDIHSEMPPDEKHYDRDRSKAEEDWRQRFTGREHDGLSVYSKYLQEDTALLSQNLRQDTSISIGDALQDAATYKAAFNSDAQFVFSRVQEHFHTKTKDGEYRPLKGCLAKNCTMKCKHDFPRRSLTERAKKYHVVCRGNARHFKLPKTGRRNALGLVLGKRKKKNGNLFALEVSVCSSEPITTLCPTSGCFPIKSHMTRNSARKTVARVLRMTRCLRRSHKGRRGK